jgi:hypothetical protein
MRHPPIDQLLMRQQCRQYDAEDRDYNRDDASAGPLPTRAGETRRGSGNLPAAYIEQDVIVEALEYANRSAAMVTLVCADEPHAAEMADEVAAQVRHLHRISTAAAAAGDWGGLTHGCPIQPNFWDSIRRPHKIFWPLALLLWLLPEVAIG